MVMMGMVMMILGRWKGWGKGFREVCDLEMVPWSVSMMGFNGILNDGWNRMINGIFNIQYSIGFNGPMGLMEY